MKICPRCQKTYTDDNLNFCLEDGSVLAQALIETPETVVLNQPRMTQQPSPMQTQQGTQPVWNPAPQQYSTQPKKSSKTWIWVLLILGVLALVCGGGFVGFLAYVGSQADKKTVNTDDPSNRKSASPTPTGGKTTTSSRRTDVQSIDLSKWVSDSVAYGTTEFTGDEFIMGAKEKGYYYVLVGKEAKTENADTLVTLRNINDAASSLGYGLIFHSNPTPLQQDYALLIDTKRKKYRVVHHEPKNEAAVVNWTSSDSIKSGSEENILEAHDLTDKIELYINGSMVTSIKNIYGYAGGVAGLYSGDGIKIAFKKLEIRKQP